MGLYLRGRRHRRLRQLPVRGAGAATRLPGDRPQHNCSYIAQPSGLAVIKVPIVVQPTKERELRCRLVLVTSEAEPEREQMLANDELVVVTGGGDSLAVIWWRTCCGGDVGKYVRSTSNR